MRIFSVFALLFTKFVSRGVKTNFTFHGIPFYSPLGPRAGAGGAKGLEVSKDGQLKLFFYPNLS